MAKKATPVITYTEILCLAIRSIDAEIGNWRKRLEGLPDEIIRERLAACTDNLNEKRDALKTMYRIETGTDYE